MAEYTGDLAELAAEDFVALAPEQDAGSVYEGVTITVGGSGNGIGSKRFAPLVVRLLDIVKTVGDDGAGNDRLYIDNLHRSETYGPGWLDGGSARIMRYSSDDNGKLIEVGTYPIIKTSCGVIGLLHGSSARIPLGTTTYEWSPKSYYQRGGDYYFAVASVDSNGNRSPWSNIATGTFPDPLAGNDVTNTTEAATIKYGIENASLTPPTGLTVTMGGADNGTFQFSWTTPADTTGVVGYIVGRCQDPNFETESYIDIVGTGVQAKDGVFLEQTFDHTATVEQLTATRYYGVTKRRKPTFLLSGCSMIQTFNETFGTTTELIKDATDGEWYYRVTFDGPHTIETSTHGGLGAAKEFAYILNPDETYISRVEARAVDVAAQDALQTRIGGTVEGAQLLPLTSGFSFVEAEFTQASVSNSTKALYSYLDITKACTIDFKLWWLGKKGTDEWTWIPEELALLQDMGPLAIRNHNTAKTEQWSYSADMALSVNSPRITMTVPRYLRLCRQIPTAPWFQIEPHWSAAEWAALAEYIHTPYVPGTDTPASKPWAYRRYQQSQKYDWVPATPWSLEPEFVGKKFIAEVGNENWQQESLGDFYTVNGISTRSNGETNGMLLEFAKTSMSACADFDSSMWKWAAGGRGTNQTWNVNNCDGSPSADYIGAANYNGGWDNGEKQVPDSESAYAWQKLVGQTGSSADRAEYDSLVEQAGIANAKAGRINNVRAITYEAGPGYVLDGLNGGSVTTDERWVQHIMLKSKGTAVATFDKFCRNAAAGYAHNNFFTFGNNAGGQTWHSHSTWIRGLKPNAPFQWAAWQSKYLSGATFRTVNIKQKVSKTIAGKDDRDGVMVYRADKGASKFIIVVNRDIESAHDVRLAIPSGDHVIRHYMTGEGYKAHNLIWEFRNDINIRQEVVTPSFPWVETIPAATVYVYEITDTEPTVEVPVLSVPDYERFNKGNMVIDLANHTDAMGPLTARVTTGPATASGSRVIVDDVVGTHELWLQVSNAAGTSWAVSCNVQIKTEYPAAVEGSDMPDQVFTLGSGEQTVDFSSYFTGYNLTYTKTSKYDAAKAATSIDNATGIMTFDTSAAVNGGVVTIKAENEHGFVLRHFTLTVA